MRPTDTYNLRKANVVVWVGEGLTPWFEGPIDYLSPTARQIELLGSPETQMPAFREGAGFGKHSHSVYAPEEKHDDHRGEHEDEHVQGDPHVWFDP
jgi:zinc transport system substrate-binding protein|tara:strand:+ start:2548 stop:2835 length:288 start_codon:yes stop_codon:yes gene_type:complete